MHVEHNVRLRHVCIRLTQNRDTSTSVIVRLSVGWLARIAQTQSCRGDKFVIGEEFLRPWNRKITTNWENWLPKHFFTDHSHSGGGRLPPPPPPYGSATARNRGNVQVIVRKDHRMRLSFLREHLVRSSEPLVLVDTKKGF